MCAPISVENEREEPMPEEHKRSRARAHARAAATAAMTVALLASGCCPRGGPAGKGSEEELLTWLRAASMLARAERLAAEVSGTGAPWRRPYALAQPRAASSLASVWFTAYPAATITAPGRSVLATLADEELWRVFGAIGISGLHTGPMKRAGGLTVSEKGRAFTPTVDGNFDRISMEIDPTFGTEEDYRALARNARASHAIVIDDVIPGHTGKGADFRLAERAYREYPGIYHMVEIDPKDWGLLPSVAAGRDSANLSPRAVDELHARGYIVGRMTRVIFYEPKVKESNWSATAPVRGADGRTRRWVYLHYFKEGQPTLNWLDPSFAAQRLLLGDATHTIVKLGASMLRLDANGFLGVEVRPDEAAWSEGHPLSATSNQLIASMVRKLGGFTFQELNLTLEDIRAMSQGGADLSYDFVTRPAYHHAIVTGDASFLRLMMRLMHAAGIDPAALIHALQNHDELTLELVHFWTAHADEKFAFRGREVSGRELRDTIRAEMHGALIGERAPYNLRAANGVSCTTASVAAAALGLRRLDKLSEADEREIQKLHLLAVFFNAFQPGVLALSGWDLVGALPLPASSVKALIAEGDTRWINRGAYDLLGRNAGVSASAAGLPRARTLYGPLPEQLKREGSFASELARLLRARRTYRVPESKLVELPGVRASGLLVLVHELPAGLGLEVTAINFGATPVEEEVAIERLHAGAAVKDLLGGAPGAEIRAGGRLALRLGPREARALLLK
jgi:trehalose synthase